MKRRWPLHPFFFAAYPVLQLFVCNVSGLKFSAPLPALAGALLLALLVTAFCRLLLRNLHQAAILASLFVWLFFSFDGFREGLRGIRYLRIHGGSSWVLGILWLLALSGALYGLRRTRSNLLNPTHILNVASGFLLLSCAPVLIFQMFEAGGIGTRKAGVQPAAVPSQPRWSGGLANAPDIYFILLDQYPRSDVLRLGFGYDNSWFLNSLRRMGFYVAEHSASNYPRTAMSLGSTLNLDYLDKLLGKVKEDNPDLGLAARCNDHNVVFSFLRQHGYRTVYLPPEFGPGNPLDVDLRLESGTALPEFDQAIMEMTPVKFIIDFCAPRYSADELHRKHVRFTLESLRKLPRRGLSPFFVYAHILCPHPPIVFGKNGESVTYDLNEKRRRIWAISPEARRFYTDQVTWISKEAEKTVAEILARSKRPPVIVLCSDHGSDFEVDWNSPENSNLQERMANLETFYFPDGGAKLLYPSITNVNIFRVLFDYYFGAHYAMLPDKSYFSSRGLPYRFIQVPMDVPYAPLSPDAP